MKKTLSITALAITALTLTSCGKAPLISQDKAIEEFAVIQTQTESKGEFKLGTKFTMLGKTSYVETYEGVENKTTSDLSLVIDLDKYYCRYYETFSSTYNGGSLYINDISAYLKDNEFYINSRIVQNNDTIETSQKVPFDEETARLSIFEVYTAVVELYDGACGFAFEYLNLDEETIKESGITFGSFGAGSLVIEENYSFSIDNDSGKRYAKIVFDNYKFMYYEDNSSATTSVGSHESFAEYSFDYERADIRY